VIIGGRLACEAQDSNHTADQRARRRPAAAATSALLFSAAFLLQRAGSRSSA
jgi:hypothetical protein